MKLLHRTGSFAHVIHVPALRAYYPGQWPVLLL